MRQGKSKPPQQTQKAHKVRFSKTPQTTVTSKNKGRPVGMTVVEVRDVDDSDTHEDLCADVTITTSKPSYIAATSMRDPSDIAVTSMRKPSDIADPGMQKQSREYLDIAVSSMQDHAREPLALACR